MTEAGSVRCSLSFLTKDEEFFAVYGRFLPFLLMATVKWRVLNRFSQQLYVKSMDQENVAHHMFNLNLWTDKIVIEFDT